MRRIILILFALIATLSGCGNETASVPMTNADIGSAEVESAAVEMSAAEEPAEAPAQNIPEASAEETAAPALPVEEAELPDHAEALESDNTEIQETDMETMKAIYIEINGRQFSVTLDRSDTADAFQNLLPAAWDMEELHGNEKYIYLDDSLPAHAQAVGYIEAGDLMLYGDNCVVLFYDSFSTSYGYTRIGWIDDPTGLAEAVGSGDITAAFGLE